MVQREKSFSTASLKRLFNKETSKRISDDSAEALDQELTERAEEISEIATEFAEEDGRKTVREEDVRKAVKLYKS